MKIKEVILCKYGEVILKGLNKRQFEKKMLADLSSRISKYGKFNVYALQSTAYAIPLSDDCDIDGAMEQALRVLGFSAVSRAAVAEKNMEDILAVAAAYLPKHLENFTSFKVESRRSDKNFPYKSPEISVEVGGAVLQATPHISVNLTQPQTIVRVEIRESNAYISPAIVRGAGGLPAGSAGKSLLLLSGGIDSPVAGYLMARRGCALSAVYFETPPYTGLRAREKVFALAEKMSAYTGKINLTVVSLTKVQEAIAANCEEEYFTLLLRRSMMRIADKLARKHRCGSLITGESLGQVASQTMEALVVTDRVTTLPVFRPCIAMDKEDIVDIARKIDTFETSCLPYDDCCALFTPRHPKTRPSVERVLEQEAKLNLEELEGQLVL